MVTIGPLLTSLLRRIVEHDFRGEKAVVRREFPGFLTGDGRRLLDLGCGSGELSHLFPRLCYVGIDISRIEVALARERCRRDYCVMSGGALGFQEGVFDHILVAGVFHHLLDTEAVPVLQEMKRVLRPHGSAVVMEDVPTVSPRNLLGRLIHNLDRGAFIRTEREYESLFARCFEVDKKYWMRSGVCDYSVFVLRPS
ncbi:MAG: class I SAM-dependent methyltransferase [Chloroflexi bacterium]|nr:class I SAM-dependent methyltransferase [Chloroflexota bacterium]